MSEKTKRIKIPDEVRNYVFNRDNYQCQSCGKTKQQTTLNIDHIIPLGKGGSNDMSNLQTLCEKCNQQKKHHFDPRFRRHSL
jgi:5-methylcytosine-specific restriction endonuclease McrA